MSTCLTCHPKRDRCAARASGRNGTVMRSSPGAADALWMFGGHVSHEPVTWWINGLVAAPPSPYGDSGAHGGAARPVTGSDTGGSTRLGTRPATRPVTVTSRTRESARDRARDFPPDHSPERTREFLRRRCFVVGSFGRGRRANRGDPPRPSGQRCDGRPVLPAARSPASAAA